MASFNRVTILGNLGGDPELRYTPQGTAVCNASIATNRKEQGQDITTWFKVTFWGKLAEIAAQYCRKGDSVFVEGRLHTEEWQDKQGTNRTTLVVNATELQFVNVTGGNTEGVPSGIPATTGVPEGVPASVPATAPAFTPQQIAPATDDDVPF